MKFASLEEADLAYSLGVIDLHAEIEVRLPDGRCARVDEETVSASRVPVFIPAMGVSCST